MRHPLFLFPIGAPFTFIVSHRFVMHPDSSRKDQLSVWTTNAALAGLAVGLSLLVGWKAVLLVQLPIMWLASMAGVWLFYVQHQYPGVYWARHDEWDYLSSAMLGASYYRLPRLLQWFTGNIGFHHIHHLAPRIPNYRLEACYAENPVLNVYPLTLRSSLVCARLALYDEQQRCLVGFRELKRR
jgi:omega-6 fatty acid desaturase (delta-12 desaturase)